MTITLYYLSNVSIYTPITTNSIPPPQTRLPGGRAAAGVPAAVAGPHGAGRCAARARHDVAAEGL